MSPTSRPLGIDPGPMDFRGARAAGFGGGCEENWLCRRLRRDRLVAGGGTEAVAGCALEGFSAAGLLDWLKRRMSVVLRAGRVSAPVPGVNASRPGFACAIACVAGIVVG
jgi:hypothetical protein